MVSLYTFTIVKSKKEFFWRCVHRNGKEICRSSETYTRRESCEKSLLNLIAAVEDQNYEGPEDETG